MNLIILTTMTQNTSLDHMFSFHETKDEDQRERIELIYSRALNLARAICENAPISTDRERAILLVKEAVLFAKSSILETESKI